MPTTTSNRPEYLPNIRRISVGIFWPLLADHEMVGIGFFTKFNFKRLNKQEAFCLLITQCEVFFPRQDYSMK